MIQEIPITDLTPAERAELREHANTVQDRFDGFREIDQADEPLTQTERIEP